MLQKYGDARHGIAVIDRDGAIVGRVMPRLVGPTIVRTRPVYDFGADAGHVAVIASARDLVQEAALVGTGGLIMGVLVFFPLRLVPIRALRRATQALTRSEHAHRQLVELSPDAVYVNCDEKIVYINPSGVRLFGAESPTRSSAPRSGTGCIPTRTRWSATG